MTYRTAIALLILAMTMPMADAPAQDRQFPTIAYAVDYYAKAKLTVELTGEQSMEILRLFLHPPGIAVRVLRTPSGCYRPDWHVEEWRKANGDVRQWKLLREPKLDDPKDRRIHAVIERIYGWISFSLVDGRLNGAWYVCGDDQYSILTDQARNNFVLRDAGGPIFGWSKQ